MLYTLTPFFSQKIKTQAIQARVKYFQKRFFQHNELRRFYFALKDRVLHTHAVVQASFSDIPQAPPPVRGLYIYIVGDQHEHCYFTR